MVVHLTLPNKTLFLCSKCIMWAGRKCPSQKHLIFASLYISVQRGGREKDLPFWVILPRILQKWVYVFSILSPRLSFAPTLWVSQYDPASLVDFLVLNGDTIYDIQNIFRVDILSWPNDWLKAKLHILRTCRICIVGSIRESTSSNVALNN